ncbi:MAG: hypothetical protein AAF668_00205 [Pseudomonadota bacterium]
MPSSIDSLLGSSARSTISKVDDSAIPETERARMRQTAEEFEGVFLSQMLKHAGFEKAFGSEAKAFSEFVLTEIGSEMAKGMDLGLAEKAYQRMVSQYTGERDDS